MIFDFKSSSESAWMRIKWMLRLSPCKAGVPNIWKCISKSYSFFLTKQVAWYKNLGTISRFLISIAWRRQVLRLIFHTINFVFVLIRWDDTTIIIANFLISCVWQFYWYVGAENRLWTLELVFRFKIIQSHNIKFLVNFQFFIRGSFFDNAAKKKHFSLFSLKLFVSLSLFLFWAEII